MSRAARVLVLVFSLASVLAATGSSASAVGWDSLGDTTFTAIGGPITIGFGGCPATTITGTVTGPTFSGSIWPAIQGTSLTHCFTAGNPTTWHCRYTLTATAQDLTVTTGTLDRTCTVSQGASQSCGYLSTSTVTYTNPFGATTGKFTFGASTLSPLECQNTGAGIPSFPETHFWADVTSGTGGPAPHQGPRLTRTP